MSPQVVGLLLLCIWAMEEVNGQPGNMPYDGYGRQLDIECYDIPTPNFCGPGQVKIRKYYFSKTTGKCTVNYNSCGRSGFFSEVDCAKTCMCRLPLNQGHACATSGPVRRFYFSRHSERCMPFTFQGCGGNGNNFPILAECQRLCRGQEVEREQVLRQLGIAEHSVPEYNSYHHPVQRPVQYNAPQQPPTTTWHNPPPVPTQPPAPPPPAPTYPPTPPPTHAPVVQRNHQTRAWNQPTQHWNDYHYQDYNQPQQRQRPLRRRNFNTGIRRQVLRRNNNNRVQRRRNNLRQNRNRRRQRLIRQRQRRRRQRKNKPTDPPTDPPTTTPLPKKKRPVYTFSLTNFNAQPKLQNDIATKPSTSVNSGASTAKKSVNNKPQKNSLSGKSKKQNANSKGNNKKNPTIDPPKAKRRRRPKPRTTEPPLYDPTTTTPAPFDAAYYDASSTTAAYEQGFNGRRTTVGTTRGSFNNRGTTQGFNGGTTTVQGGTTDAYYY